MRIVVDTNFLVSGVMLAAAVAANADLIASGDQRDLLPLGRYEGIAIVTARQALEAVRQGV